MTFNFYALVNLVNALSGLTIASIIFFKKGRKLAQVTYGLFSLFLFFWGFFYWIWANQTDPAKAIYWFKMVMYPVCMIHAFYLHFTIAICEKISKFEYAIVAGYLSSLLCVLINSFNGFFDLNYVRYRPPFLFWPHASSLLIIIIAVELLCVGLSLYVLAISNKEATGTNKSRYSYLFAVGVLGWIGAVTNWFYFYDFTSIPPVGNPVISVYLIFTFYLIFKHDLLGLNFAVKKTFIYTLLTLCISLIYALFVTLSERLFQSFIGYSSLIGSFFAALTIALMFNPLRNLITGFTDKRFFGKSIAELSVENLQMRFQLENQDRMKAVATLAAGMAHEIKNPLTSIKTFAEYLPKKYDDPEFRAKFSRLVVDEVDRVNNIVKQLLEFSKPTDLQLKAVLVPELLDETLSLLNSNLVKRDIVLTKDFDRYSMILADKNQLKQAMLNLFLNAIQSIPEKGKLEVSARTESNGYVKVSITDTGCGMAKEQLQHVFDPFYTTKEDGTGLGLAIVHSIITKHGGKISMESELGKGTTVNVFLKSQS